MQRLCLLLILITTTMLAITAEPVGADKRGPSTATAPVRARQVAPPAPGKKTVTAQSSLFNSEVMTAAASPGVYYPDLVPKGTAWAGSCGWDEAAGETCESKCPPEYVDLPFGTRNASNRALDGTGKVKVVAKATGQLLREYTFSGLPSHQSYMPGKIRKQIVWCHTGTSVTQISPTHDLIVETAATEANKNNNNGQFYVGPDDQLILP